MMDGWKEVKLGNTLNLLNGYAFKSKFFTDNEDDIVLIKGSNLGKGVVLWNSSKYWNKADELKFSKYLLQTGDVLLAMDRPWVSGGLKYASIKKNDPKSFLVQRIACLRTNDKMCQKFLKYVVANIDFAAYIKSLQGGVGVPHISPSQIKNYKLNLPPLKNQHKIASILSRYDDLIENNLKRIKLLEEQAQQTYEEWFVRFKFPGYENVVFDKESGLPVGWEKVKLKEIADFQNGYAFYTKGYSETGYKIIDLGNVSEYGDLNISGKEKLISNELYNSLPKFHLKKYDIVIAMTDVTSALRILAKSAIIDKDNTYALNQRVGMLRPNTELFDFAFLYALLSDPRFIGRMKAMSKGAVQFYFNTKDIVNYETFLPAKKVIDDFTKIYKPILELRMKLKAQNQHLKEARDILLPRLMSGIIDVEQLNIKENLKKVDVY